MNPAIHVIEAFAVLCELQVQELIFEDFISTDDVWCLRRYIDPFVDDPAHLVVSRRPRATVIFNLVSVDYLEDKLVVDVCSCPRMSLRNADEALGGDDIADLMKKSVTAIKRSVGRELTSNLERYLV